MLIFNFLIVNCQYQFIFSLQNFERLEHSLFSNYFNRKINHKELANIIIIHYLCKISDDFHFVESF